MLLMGKSTISTGPFSIAMLNYQRVDDFDPTMGCSPSNYQITMVHGDTMMNPWNGGVPAAEVCGTSACLLAVQVPWRGLGQVQHVHYRWMYTTYRL